MYMYVCIYTVTCLHANCPYTSLDVIILITSTEYTVQSRLSNQKTNKNNNYNKGVDPGNNPGLHGSTPRTCYKCIIHVSCNKSC